MNDRRTRWTAALVLWLGVAMLACSCTRPEPTQVTSTTVPPLPVTPTPHATAAPPVEAATETVPVLSPTSERKTGAGVPTGTASQPSPTASKKEWATLPVASTAATEKVGPTAERQSGGSVLNDLPQELAQGMGGGGGTWLECSPDAPELLPAVQADLSCYDCGVVCLWGFPPDRAVHVELYDPVGKLVAAHGVTVDQEWAGVGLVHMPLSFAGRPTGDWVIVAYSAGTRFRAPLHVGEPEHPAISIHPLGADPYIAAEYMFHQWGYALGDQIAVFGVGFPPARTLPLGIYRYYASDLYKGDLYSLVYSQEVRTDDQGRFEVRQAVQALAMQGGGRYLALVPLDPSYRPVLGNLDDLGACVGFLVRSEWILEDLPMALGDDMQPNEVLYHGHSISSANGQYTLVYQVDGNLVLYQESDWVPLWYSNTGKTWPGVCVMQADGNLVIYDPNAHPVWSTGTAQHPGSRLVVQNDGNVVIYRPDNTPIWATNTVQP